MPDLAEPRMVKYLHDKGLREGIPISGTFELTQRCNFNCEMCYVHDFAQKTDPLSAREWLDLAQQARDAGTVFLLLTGGEPLLHPEFEEIYVSLVKMGFIVSINTNGSLLEKYVGLFKELPPSRINVSLYGSSSDTYARLCKSDAFDRVLSAIKQMKSEGISMRINTLLTPQNFGDYKEIADISRELGIPLKPATYSYPSVRLGKESHNQRFSPEEAAKCITRIDEYRFEKEFYLSRAKKIVALPKGPDHNRVRCRAGRASYWITADGVMRPCGMMPEPDSFPLTDGFQKAWQDIRTATEQIRLPEECITCKYNGICNVCTAMCVAENGDFAKLPQYVCRMTRHLYTLAERSVRENGD